MPNLYGALSESEALFAALRGIGFKGWDRILNDQGVVRLLGQEVFEGDEINVHFQEKDFIERTDAWNTVVALIKDRGKALDQFTMAQAQLELSRVHTDFISQGTTDAERMSASLEKRKQDRGREHLSFPLVYQQICLGSVQLLKTTSKLLRL